MTLPAEKDHFLGQIVEEASEGLYRYAVVLSRDRVEAQDLVQETCARAIGAVDSLRPGTNVKSWLFYHLAKHLVQPAAAAADRS